MKFSFFFLSILFLWSCQSDSTDRSAPLTKEDQITSHIDSLKRTAEAGDLIVRLGDDILSYQIKFLNEMDQSYSHAGLIVENNGRKVVAHIAPDSGGKDVINYIAIDSFVNPAKNFSCALYRYDLPEVVKDSISQVVETYRLQNVHFDWQYDLATNDRMYCSEMISKAIAKAANNSIHFKEVNAPKKMQPLLLKYFKGQLSKKTIEERKIMTIDNLYLKPEARLVMKFALKVIPGE